jgi:hypothetical protein
VTRLFLLGWRDLARSREAILRQHYVNAAGSHGVSLDDSLSLDDARQGFLDSLQIRSQPSSSAIDSLESKIILGSRICAAWQVLWGTILPLSLTGWWSTHRVLSLPHNNLAALVSTLASSLLLFFVASFCGLFIQQVFARPFSAFMTWFLRLDEGVW